MRGFLIICLALTLTMCTLQPVYADSYEVRICALDGFAWSGIVRYKDAGVYPHDVVEVIAPRLNLPRGWEDIVENVVTETYNQDLTKEQLFTKMFLKCMKKYSV